MDVTVAKAAVDVVVVDMEVTVVEAAVNLW